MIFRGSIRVGDDAHIVPRVRQPKGSLSRRQLPVPPISLRANVGIGPYAMDRPISMHL